VDGKRDASTVEAMSAAFVLRLAGMFLFPPEVEDWLGAGEP
jgi:hypothetical protein